MSRNKVGGPGSYWAICDECGFRFKASKLMRRWDGAMVDAACFEPRHAQDFIRAKKDSNVLPFIRSDIDGIDVSPALNCDAITREYWTLPTLNAYLGDDLTIYKVTMLGNPTITIPDGTTVTVLCEWII